MDDFRNIVPSIKPRRDQREIKWLVTFYVEGAPPVRAEDGSVFTPSKVEVKNWPRLGRAYVTVTGPHGWMYRSQNFNLKGAPKYQDTPEWLRPLIKEAMSDANPI